MSSCSNLMQQYAFLSGLFFYGLKKAPKIIRCSSRAERCGPCVRSIHYPLGPLRTLSNILIVAAFLLRRGVKGRQRWGSGKWKYRPCQWVFSHVFFVRLSKGPIGIPVSENENDHSTVLLLRILEPLPSPPFIPHSSCSPGDTVGARQYLHSRIVGSVTAPSHPLTPSLPTLPTRKMRIFP